MVDEGCTPWLPYKEGCAALAAEPPRLRSPAPQAGPHEWLMDIQDTDPWAILALERTVGSAEQSLGRPCSTNLSLCSFLLPSPRFHWCWSWEVSLINILPAQLHLTVLRACTCMNSLHSHCHPRGKNYASPSMLQTRNPRLTRVTPPAKRELRCKPQCVGLQNPRSYIFGNEGCHPSPPSWVSKASPNPTNKPRQAPQASAWLPRLTISLESPQRILIGTNTLTQECQSGNTKGHFERSPCQADNKFKRMFNQIYLSDSSLNPRNELEIFHSPLETCQSNQVNTQNM